MKSAAVLSVWFGNGLRAMLLACCLGSLPAPAATNYVWQESPSPTPPFTNWATAAHTIQDAVDAAQPGDTVLVTNGIYATGGRALPDQAFMTNRVTVDKPLILQSVNGPEVTVIRGYGRPGLNYSDETIRCVYLTNGALLTGFTLTNGQSAQAWSSRGGGVFCVSTNASVSNCFLLGNSALDWGGGAYRGTLDNCTLSGNSAITGAGAVLSTLNNCILVGNSAREGSGGAYLATLNNCTVLGNSAGTRGGGVAGSTLNHCILISNSAYFNGGGASTGTLNDCILTGNSAGADGGATYNSTLNNCSITTNSAGRHGGGALGGALTNCTLISNTATNGSGGGTSGSVLDACTLSGNSAGDWGGGANGGTLNNCLLSTNSAGQFGGGALNATLKNCTLVGNSAWRGGGASGGTLNNCILHFNTAPDSPNYYQDQYGGVLNYCCTTPLPTIGVGNITNAPLFIDTANGDFRLQSNSPCIDAGNNAYAPSSADLDANPRIARLRVDIGAYEYQGPGLSPYIAWLQQYGLPTDGSADFTDTDGDLMNNQQEWTADTNPTNVSSVLRISSIVYPPAARVTFDSSAARAYSLTTSTNLDTPVWTLVPGATDVPGTGTALTLTDTNPPNTQTFYRVSVRLP